MREVAGSTPGLDLCPSGCDLAPTSPNGRGTAMYWALSVLNHTQ
jgi:hypothetical protein